jgi:polysaccharide biosynthesis transport protein
MQHTLTNVRAHSLRIERDGDAANTVDVDTVIRGARRQWKVLAASMAAILFLAVIYFALATKKYTGTTNVLIDTRIFGTSAPNDEQAGLIVSDTALDSQVEIINSQKVALTVINKLDLLNDPEFVRPSLFAKILSLIGLSKRLSPEEEKAVKEARVLDKFADRLTVTRTNKTFVLEIDFLSQDPKKAADIANAIATAYVSDEVESRQEAATRASTWLRERIVELKQKSAEADRVVQQYRETNSLITAGGRLINDQQLSELNSQVSDARADLARAQAKYDHIQAIIANRGAGATVSEELSSPVITNLRTLYFQTAKRKTDLAARVGQNHDQVLNAERQMRNYENQIFEELGRIAESYRSDLEVARGREQSLSENLTRLVGSSANDNRTAIDLRQHQQSMEAYQILYEKSLQLYEELLHQQSFTMTETRVIAQALPQISPSEPKLILVLALGLFGGITIGTGAAIYREYRDRTFRRADQIQFELDLDFLGVLPLQTADIIEKYAGSRAPKNPNIFPSIPASFKICAAYPFSRFADTMGAIKVAIDSPRAAHAQSPAPSEARPHAKVQLNSNYPGGRKRAADLAPLLNAAEKSKVIGVVSTVQREGKTVASANLALFCALTGAKTLLIDADLRRCDLSTKLAPDALSGIAAVVSGDVGIAETLKQLSEHLWFLPAGKACGTVNSSELVRSDGMKRLLVNGADLFDYIIIDLPPLLSMVDGRAIEPFVTQFLYIVEWGTVSRHVVRDALSQNTAVYKKCLGVVLNKVNRKLISRYVAGDAHGCQYNMYC